MSEVELRLAEPAEFPAVADLRWRWETEGDIPPSGDREAFRRGFAAWAKTADTHRCVVAVRDSALIGMAWLAILPRVPTPNALVRAAGDVQSVYIVPEERGGGLGGRLIEAVLAIAEECALERVTVHSTICSVSAYRRFGFTESPKLMQVELVMPPGL